jgi:Na+(H+)/acetate symporter ActP
LYVHTGMRTDARGRVGSRAGEYIINPNISALPYRAVLWLVYVIPWVLTIFYTVYMLVKYVQSGWMLVAMTAFYLSLAAVAAAAGYRAIRDTPKVPSNTA